MPRIDERSWKKIFELGNNGKYDDEAYAEILATVLNLRVEKGLTQSDVARISSTECKKFLTIYFRLRFGLGTCS